MKKFILLLSLLSSSAFALHCPPGSALHHPVNGGDWELDAPYKALGFYFESDLANAVEVPAGTPLDVKINETTNDKWIATCLYVLNDEKGSIKLFNSHEVQSPIPPNSSPFNSGHCQTTSDNPAACSWSTFDK